MLIGDAKNEWDSWSDSGTLMLRPLPGVKRAYEYLVDRDFLDGRKTYIRHGVIFLSDYLATREGAMRLEKTLNGFGYNDLADFLNQNLDDGETLPTMSVYDDTCPERLLRLLTALLIESLTLGTEDDRSICFEDKSVLKTEIDRILGKAQEKEEKRGAGND